MTVLPRRRPPRARQAAADDRLPPPRARRAVRMVRTLGFLVSSLGALAAFGIGAGPYTGRYRTVTVLTGSMRPALPVGSVVVVTPEDPRTLRPGQIITYRAPLADHRVVTHRVVEVREGGGRPVVVTRGDANPGPDPWTARLESAPVWRVRAAVPYAGYWVILLRRPLVHRVAVQVVPILLALSWLRAIWRRPAHARSVSDAPAPT